MYRWEGRIWEEQELFIGEKVKMGRPRTTVLKVRRSKSISVKVEYGQATELWVLL